VPIISFIEGDGIGPDIWRASQLVMDNAVRKAYGGKRRINWLEVLAGEKSFSGNRHLASRRYPGCHRKKRGGDKGTDDRPGGKGDTKPQCCHPTKA
jgi:isocitrate dehydrogenase